jgi:phosphate transport system permease protein
MEASPLSSKEALSAHKRRRMQEAAFLWLCRLAVLTPLALLAWLLGDVLVDGASRIGLDFFTSYPSRKPEKAGIYPAILGTLWLMGLTAAFVLPVGAGAALYLEEYARRGRLARLIEVNISNLAGVPSIVYGLLGLTVFVRFMGLGRSLVAGALTLGLLVLPIVIVATREALKQVPTDLREAAVGLGATKWQVLRHVVLPMALPGMLTGSILAISRAIGETAPIVVVGALTYMTFVPDGPMSEFTALPIQIFNWVSRPQKGFMIDSAAGIVVLLVVMLAMNAIAILLRDRLQRRLRP